MNPKKLLITGGAGFIGSAVIRYIINNTNYSVVNIDKLTYAGNLESLTSVENDPRYTFEKVDICNTIEVSRVLQKELEDDMREASNCIIDLQRIRKNVEQRYQRQSR